MTALLGLCFTLSGAAALALEMLWMRSATLVFGQTAVTTATVLACYFAGLGIGAAAARGLRQHTVWIYGLLEIGAAIGALWSRAVFHLLVWDGAQHWLATSGHAGGIAAVAVAVLPATICLGATFPALGHALADAATIGWRAGWLYALNTVGGAIGTVAAGFGLPALIGVSASYLAAATVSGLAGTLALAVASRSAAGAGRPEGVKARGREGKQQVFPPYQGGTEGGFAPTEHGASSALQQPAAVTRTPAHTANQRSVSQARLRTVAATAGALGIGLEVLWTRLFAQVLHNSVYSFSAIALVFLLALALGAAIAAILLRRIPPRTLAATALLCAAVSTVGGVWLFMQWTDGLAYIGMRSGLGEYLRRIVALAAVTAGPTAVASGALLPALWAAWGGNGGAARPLGDLSAANTFGGIAGAVASGFLALPVLGLRATFLFVAVAYVVLAALIAAPHGPWRRLGAAVLLGVALLNPLRLPITHLRSDSEVVRATMEGASGIVTVVDSDGDLQLRLDNYYVLGGSAAATSERRLGFVPLLLHPDPHQVAFIGLATGISASAAPVLGVAHTTVVELVPEVAAAARTHFGAWNGHLLERPDVHLVIGDGRRYLTTTSATFDVIVSDLFIPWHAGAGNLYSREMYETVARRLAPNGLFCQWLPLYQLTRAEFDLIARTMLSVFPRLSVWRADFYADRPVVGLIAQINPWSAELERAATRVEQLPQWSHDPLLATPQGLAMLYAGELSAGSDLVGGHTLNTDDRPLIEFQAPRLTRLNAAGDKDWFIGEPLADFYDALAAQAATPDPLLPMSENVDAARRAGTLLYRYALAATSHDQARAGQLEAEVRQLVPEVIAAAESTDAMADLTDARRKLIGLRTEQEAVRRQLDAIEHRLGELARNGRERSDTPGE